MADQSRVAKVLGALLVSMTTGAAVLMALGNNPPSAGAFCLSSYYRLGPVKEAIASGTCQLPDRWNKIEIYYSGTEAGNIEYLTSLQGLAIPDDLNYHFVICNGFGGLDGQVQPTERWQKQWSSLPDRSWYGGLQTIRICIIADGKNAHPTNYQIKRTEALIEGLCRVFNINPQSIYYPGDWL
jgi:hypothetical protein